MGSDDLCFAILCMYICMYLFIFTIKIFPVQYNSSKSVILHFMHKGWTIQQHKRGRIVMFVYSDAILKLFLSRLNVLIYFNIDFKNSGAEQPFCCLYHSLIFPKLA